MDDTLRFIDNMIRYFTNPLPYKSDKNLAFLQEWRAVCENTTIDFDRVNNLQQALLTFDRYESCAWSEVAYRFDLWSERFTDRLVSGEQRRA